MNCMGGRSTRTLNTYSFKSILKSHFLQEFITHFLNPMNSIYYGWKVSCFHHGEVLCNTQQMDNFTSDCKLRECTHIKLLINARMYITSQFYCEWHISQLFKCSLKEFGALKVHILCFLTLLLIKIILKYSWRRKFAAQLIVLAEFSWFFFPSF